MNWGDEEGSGALTGAVGGAAWERSLSSSILSIIRLRPEAKGDIRADVRVSIAGLKSSSGSSEAGMWWNLDLEPLARRDSSWG